MFLRKILPAILLLFICSSLSAYDTSRRAFCIIKLHPFQIGERYLSYEQVLNRRHSFEIGGGSIHRVMMPDSISMLGLPQPRRASGFSIRAQFRTYITKSNVAPFGFYHAPKVTFRSMKVKYDEFSYDPVLNAHWYRERQGRYSVLALHYMFGIQGRIAKPLSFNFEAGLGGRIKNVPETVGNERVFHSMINGMPLGSSPLPEWYLAPSFQFNFNIGLVIYRPKES